MVGLDGCHLKGRYKGQLLTAVGIGANNGMFPVAYAVVESEDTETWTWFMELFIDDVAIMNEGLGWVIISDKQKGLKNCINSLLPEVEHRFCVRHLHENFKLDGHVGNLLKQQLWTIARTTTQPWFRKEMEVMLKMSPPAHDWLMVRPATQWSRSHFQTHSKCDIMLNNLCEAFNKALLSARKLSIISMLEEIRVYLMLRMTKQREVEWNQVVGPRIMGILEKNQLAATECSYLYAGNMTYEVQSSSQRTFAVDLGKKTCSCRRWELCGLPCPHAISAMTTAGVDFVERSHAWYKRDKYDAAYANHISPMPDWTQWKRHDQPTLNAPDIKAQPGRRKLKRKLAMDETRRNAQTLKKLFSQMRCTKCGEIGHNTQTCGQIPEVERQARARFIKENRVKTGVEPPAPLQPRTTRTRRSASQASNSHLPQPSPPRVPLALVAKEGGSSKKKKL